MSHRNDAGHFCTLADKIEDTFNESNPSALQTAVATWVLEQSADYDGIEGPLKDLAYGGCQSGMVSELIYYTDTVAFYQEHRREVEAMVASQCEDMGVDGPAGLFGGKWDTADPFAHDTSNQNLLAWFGFEETARALGSMAGLDL